MHCSHMTRECASAEILYFFCIIEWGGGGGGGGAEDHICEYIIPNKFMIPPFYFCSYSTAAC